MRFTLGFFLLSFISGLAHAGDVQLLTTSESFHGDEVKVTDTKNWLALYKTGKGYELVKVDLLIKTVVDEIVDKDPKKPTGKSVAVRPARKEEPIFIIKDKSGKRFSEGPVEAIDAGIREAEQAPGRTFALPFQKQLYELLLGGKLLKNSGGYDEIKDFEITLKLKDQSQQLHKEVDPGHSPGLPTRFFWTGDLDRDGKLDILFDATNHYNVTRLVLYLSSAAKGKELVGKVAEFETVGC